MALSSTKKIVLLATHQNTTKNKTQEEVCVTENAVSDNVYDKTENRKAEDVAVEGCSKWVTVSESESNSSIKVRLCRVHENPPKGCSSSSGDSSYEEDVDNSDEDPNFTYSSSDSSEVENRSTEESDKLGARDAQLEAENVRKEGKKRRAMPELWKKNKKKYAETRGKVIFLILRTPSQLRKELCNSLVKTAVDLNALKKSIINRGRQYLKIIGNLVAYNCSANIFPSL